MIPCEADKIRELVAARDLAELVYDEALASKSVERLRAAENALREASGVLDAAREAFTRDRRARSVEVRRALKEAGVPFSRVGYVGRTDWFEVHVPSRVLTPEVRARTVEIAAWVLGRTVGTYVGNDRETYSIDRLSVREDYRDHDAHVETREESS